MSDPAAPAQSDATSVMVRQAVALAVVDAVAHMRRVNTIAATAMGVAERMVMAGYDAQSAVMASNLAQGLVDGAAQNFIRICEAAARHGALDEGAKDGD